jgi:hypothetical protein
MRTVFQPVGQTELKRWLADLHATDGVDSIGKAVSQPSAMSPGSGEMEGKDVVLSDSASQSIDVGEDETSLDVLGRAESESRPRITRHRSSENLLPVPDDKEVPVSARQSRAEFSLPVPDDDGGPPGRRRRRSGGRGLLTIFFVGALLVVGAWLAGSYMGFRVQDPTARAGAPADSTSIGPPKPPTTSAPTPGAAGAAGESESAAAKKPPPPAENANAGAAAESRERAGKKARGAGASSSDHLRHGMMELKNMMAPDPSLLPPQGAAAPEPKHENPEEPAPPALPPPSGESEKTP